MGGGKVCQSALPVAVGPRSSGFVLEVPGGWCADNGVREGDTVRLGGLASYQAR